MEKIEVNNSHLKEIQIVRDGEEVGSIYFDPVDTSLIPKLDKLCKTIEGLDFEFKNDDIGEVLNEMNRVDKELRAAIDDVFGEGTSQLVFGNSYTFTTHNGVSALETFFDGAMKIIMKATAEEDKKSAHRQAKYLSKYGK